MNIFASHMTPQWSARWLDDKRANQMIRESGQLLSTTINLLEGTNNEKLYETFGPNHPCRLWAGSSRSRFAWLLLHMAYLLGRARQDTHERAREVFAESDKWFGGNKWKLPAEQLLPFVNCAGNDGKGISFKGMKDPNLAYRLYLNERWKTDKVPPKWETGTKPNWAEV